MNGQSSGAWKESSSALRIMYVTHRNSTGVLTDDAYTQANPVAVTTNVSAQVDTRVTGVLSGSVAFTRPDAGNDYIGGPGNATVQTALRASALYQIGYNPLGLFINNANGNAWENTPGVASGRGPYVSGLGTFGNALYETAMIAAAVGGDPAAATAVTYGVGMALIASRNGFLMPKYQLTGAGAVVSADSIACAAQSYVANADNSSTTIGILKMVPDSARSELVYDQRI